MIVTTDTGSAAVILGPGSERIRVRCLARRDMLRSACASFDHLRLSPGACHEVVGRQDAETAWYVLRGPLLAGRLLDRPQHLDHPQYLAAEHDLLLVPAGQTLQLQAGPLGAELLCLTLAPKIRRPAAPRRRRRTGRTVRP